MIISTPNLELAKQLIKKSNEKPIIVQAQNAEFNRKLLEFGKFDILIFPENKLIFKKDVLKWMDSGLNHISAKLASKNNIKIGINLTKLRELEKKEGAVILSRIIQNIRICRKAKAKIVLLNAKDKKDAFNFLISLGASTEQAKEATHF